MTQPKVPPEPLRSQTRRSSFSTQRLLTLSANAALTSAARKWTGFAASFRAQSISRRMTSGGKVNPNSLARKGTELAATMSPPFDKSHRIHHADLESDLPSGEATSNMELYGKAERAYGAWNLSALVAI